MSLKNAPDVSWKVRYHMYRLEEFTVANLVDATGENLESVRSVVKRLLGRGALTRPAAVTTGGRGKLTTYRIVAKHAEWRSIAESIEALYPAEKPGERPTCPSYFEVQRHLAQAQFLEQDLRQDLLRRAEAALEQAHSEEGWFYAPPSVLSYLGFERVRIAWLRQDYALVRKAAQELLPAFEEIGDEWRANELRLMQLIAQNPPQQSESAAAYLQQLLSRPNLHSHDAPNPLSAVFALIAGQGQGAQAGNAIGQRTAAFALARTQPAAPQAGQKASWQHHAMMLQQVISDRSGGNVPANPRRHSSPRI